MREWNASALAPRPVPSDARSPTLHARFRAWARRTPDAIAVSAGGRALSYGALERRAVRLAGRLRRAGVGPESIVGLCAERSVELVEGVLAVLEAGGAYLPLDPGLPAARRELILGDAGASLVLVQAGLEDAVPAASAGSEEMGAMGTMGAPDVTVLRFGDGRGEETDDGPDGSPDGWAPTAEGPRAAGSQPLPDNLAYVIYTSGSTGRPKGSLLTHGNAARLFDATRAWFGPSPEDAWTLFHSFAFDFSVWELWGALAHGGRLEVVPYWVSREPRAFLDLVRDRRVTVLSQTPSAFKQIVAADAGPAGVDDSASPASPASPASSASSAGALRAVVFGGEALEPAALAPWIARHGDGSPRLVNMYGITETTVHVTYRPVTAADATSPAGSPAGSPIGVGIPDLRVHLLDPAMAPVPVGVPGEIHVGGPGLARGYLARPALTAERFVPDPLAEGLPGERLYKAGDLARRLPDGGLDFLGRIDHQVKVRGFRIELGEIEAVLVRHPEVAQVAVVARDDRDDRGDGGGAAGRPGSSGGTYLAAYVVPSSPDPDLEPDRAPAIAALREHCGAVLPDYMVPAAWVMLDELPLTGNGKLDRRALPVPTFGSSGSMGAGGDDRAYQAPRGAVEEAVAAVYAEVLGAGRVGSGDDFFALGGHSLLATQVVSRLGDRLGMEPSLRELFESPRVADLARGLAARLEDATGSAGTASVTEKAGQADPTGQARRGELDPAARAELLARPGPRPLSAAQRRIWFLDRLLPGSALYNVPGRLALHGPLRPAALAAALSAVTARHQALRVRVATDDQGPVQVVEPAAPVPLPVIDLSRLGALAGAPEGAPPVAAGEAERLARAAARRPFDLATGPLLRAGLLRLGPAIHHLVLVLHHLVADGWSMGILVREAAELYRAAIDGRRARLEPLPLQFPDYALLEQHRLVSGALDGQLAAWCETLAGLDRLALPTDRPRTTERTGWAGEARIRLGGALSEALDELGRRAEASRFMVALAVLQALLGRTAGTDDVAVGSPVANRHRLESEPLIGCLVNTLVLRGDLSSGPAGGPDSAPAGDPAGYPAADSTAWGPLTGRGHLARVRRAALAAFDRQEVPFERLVEAMARRAPRDSAGRGERELAPLFEVLLTYQNVPHELPSFAGLESEPLPSAPVGAKFDLSFELVDRERGDGLELRAVYDRDLFDATTVQRLLGRFRALAAALAEHPDRPLAALSPLTPAERQQALEWNAAVVADSQGAEAAPEPLHVRFRRQARRAPDAVAVAIDDRALTYGALARRVVTLAGRLRRAGVGPDDLVALCAERSIDLVVALLAILEAGGAYLPLDPGVPAARLELILEDAAPAAVLVQAGLEDRLPGAVEGDAGADDPAGPRRLVIAEAAEGETAPDATSVLPDSLAYVIYTSGSTGRPKGTLITHRAAARLFDRTAPWFGFGTEEARDGVWTLFHSYAFDFSVWELWGALAHGGRLEIVPYWVSRSPQAFLDLLRDRRVTVLSQTPSAFKQLVAAEASAAAEASPGPRTVPPVPSSLRRVVFGGEALEPASLAPWIARHGAERPALINMYGITETTVHVTYRPVTAADVEGVGASPVGSPIGAAIPDLRLHLLDPAMEPVPLGVPGEIHVGGPGLARGYLDRPALTAERFVPDPFAASIGRSGERLYKAGDLARRMPDGGLDFLGRIDHQVKIRGFRIELGEIEAVLARHPQVAQVAVLARGGRGEGAQPGGGASLAAYVVPRAGADGSIEALREHCARELPDYMVPTAWAVLEALPLTVNGKLDRQALPEPEAAGGDERPFVAPRGPVEEAVAAVYADVLGVGRVGAHDSFFDLGGHSLLATQAVSRLGHRLGVEPSLRELFETPDVAGLAALLRTRLGASDRGERPDARDAAARGEAWRALREEIARQPGPRPLSAAQKRIWFFDRLDPGSALYNVPARLALRGLLRPAALAAALSGIAARHEVLRVRVAEEDEGPVQVVRPAARVPLPVIDLSGLSGVSERGPARAVREAERLAAGAARRPFDLAAGPLLRASLLRLGPAIHHLVLVLHHVVADGWSMGIFVREVGELYRASAAGRPPALAPLDLQFPDYALLEERRLASGLLDDQIDAWCAALAGLEALDLPTDRPRGAAAGEARRGPGGTASLLLGPELTEALDRLARSADASRFMVVLAVLQAFLGRTAGVDDVAVGTVVANRHRLESEALIGCLVNTLVLRADLAAPLTGRDHLARVRRTALDAFGRQDLPYERLVEELARRAQRHDGEPLFNVFLGHLNAPFEMPALEGLATEALPAATVGAKFDLAFELADGPDGLSLHLSYDRALFDPTTAGRLLARVRALATDLAARPEAPVETLSLLPAAERHQVVTEWRAALPRAAKERDAPPAGASGLHGLVWEQAARTPDAVALVLDLETGGRQVTYGALVRRAEALAGRLARHLEGAGPERAVGVYLERSVEAVVALLGCLEAGAVYLPLDPASPDERLAYVLRDATPVAVVADRSGADRLTALLADADGRDRGEIGGAGDTGATPPAMVLLDDAVRHDRQPAPRPRRPARPADPDRLAYVIYTSGSTGRPKGVGVAHGAAVAHVRAAVAAYGLGPADRAPLFGSLSFDISIEEILGPLAAGARLSIREGGPFEVPRFRRLVAEHRLTCLNLPTAAWAEWVRQQPDGGTAGTDGLRLVVTGGEAMPAEAAERFRRAVPGAVELLNAYGPTEAVVTSTVHRVDGDPGRGWEQVPIGRPLGADRAVVADAALRPVPVGVAGELLLGGPGLARGYLGRPGLTAERFVPDPLSQSAGWTASAGSPGAASAGGRLYRTGDLVRWLPDGSLAFLGRNDRQVKVRGFRIELGEIEAALARAPGVGAAVVVARAAGGGGGDRRVTAYLVPAPEAARELEAAFDLDAVRGHCAATLPPYMVPAAWVVLPELPLTATGKVDHRALPEPAAGSTAADRFVAPRRAAEELIAGAFAAVLDLDRVGVHDSFFEVGGHSLKATRLAARLRALLGREVPLRLIFERPTVAGLAAALGGGAEGAGDGTEERPIVALPRPAGVAELPLSFSQERLWFLDRLRPGTSEYNIPQVLRLTGALRPDLLARAWTALVARHEALRTVFVERASGRRGPTAPLEIVGPVQRVLPARRQALPVVDLEALPPARRETVGRALVVGAARAPFDLVTGPLLRTTLVRLGAEEHLLVAVVHHIVADGWSVEVLVRELVELWGAALAGRPPALAPLPVQYGDYAAWEREHLAGARLDELLRVWTGRLAGLRPLELPTDRPRPAERVGRGGTVRRHLPAALRSGLDALARRHGVTPFMVLTAAFQALLARLAGDDDVALGTPIANRRRGELEPLIGFFVNTLVLRGDLSGDPPFATLLERTREISLEAYAHQELPFERLVEELAPARDPSRTPLFQVMVTFQAASVGPLGETAQTGPAGCRQRRRRRRG